MYILVQAAGVLYCPTKKKKKKEYIKYDNIITPLQNISEPLTKYHKATVRKASSEKENIYRTNKWSFLNIH